MDRERPTILVESPRFRRSAQETSADNRLDIRLPKTTRRPAGFRAACQLETIATADMAENASTNPVQSAIPSEVPVIALPKIAPVDAAERTAEVASLLQSLDEAAAQIGRSSSPVTTERQESELVHARLGIASGLHTALRCRDPGTASHCLRVALGCSSWASVAELEPDVRDALEVAALLHDVGKIGVADKVLLKPGRLSPEEAESMSRHTAMTVEILANCARRRQSSRSSEMPASASTAMRPGSKSPAMPSRSALACYRSSTLSIR